MQRASMEWFWAHYLAEDSDAESPFASPLLAPDLSGLPPALVVTCEFDPLHDEGEAYGQRLSDSGTLARISRYDGMVHGFFLMAGVIDRSRALIDEVGNELRAALSVVESDY